MATITTLGFTIFSTYNGRGTSAARRDLIQLTVQVTATNVALGGTSSAMAGVQAAAVALAPALIPIGTAAAGAGAATAAMATSAGTAFGVYGAALAGAIKRTQEMAKAKKELAPVQKSFITATKDMKGAWEEFIKGTQGMTLSTATTVLQGVTGAIGRLKPLVTAVHPVIKGLADDFKNWAAGDGFKRFIDVVIAYGVPALQSLINAGKSVVATLGIGFRTFAPEGVKVAQALERGAAAMKLWAQTGGFQRFLQTVQANAPAVKEFFKALWDALKNVGTAMAGLGPLSLGLATGILKLVAALPPSWIQAIVVGFVAWRAAIMGIMIVQTLVAIFAALKTAVIALRSAWFILNIAFAGSPIGLIITAIVALVAGIVYLATQTKFFQTVWNAVWGAVKTAALAVWNALKVAWNAVVNALVTAWNAVGTALKTAWTAVWNAIKIAAEAVWNFLKAAWNLFITGLMTIWNTVSGALKTAWTTVWNAIKAAAEVVWNAMKAAWNLFITGLMTIWNTVSNALKTAWNAVWNALKTAAEAVWNALKTAFQAAVQFYVTIWNTVGNALKAAWSAVWNAIKAAAEAVWNAIKAAWQAAINAVKAAWDAVGNALKAAWSAVWNAIKAAAEAVWNAIKTAWKASIDHLKSVWDTVGNAIKTAWQTVWNAIKAAGEAVWNAIKGAWQALLDAVRAAWNAAADAIKGSWKAVWDAIKAAAEAVWNGLKTAAGKLWDALKDVFNKGKDFLLNTFWTPVKKFFTETIPAGFKAGVDAVGKAWETIKNIVRKPIQAVIDVVYNKGIVKVWNAVATKFGAKKLDEYKLPQFATGGAVKGPGTGKSDSIVARLSHGEHVWTAREVAAAGGHRAVLQLRQAVSQGKVSEGNRKGMFHEGGEVDAKYPFGHRHVTGPGGIDTVVGNNDPNKGIGEQLADATGISKLKDLALGAIAAVANPLIQKAADLGKSTVKKIIPGEPGLEGMIAGPKGLIQTMADKVKDWIKQNDVAQGGAGNYIPFRPWKAGDEQRMNFRGVTVNKRTKEMLEKAEGIAKVIFSMTQGSYNAGGVDASAGTHDGGGVVDIAQTANSVVGALRASGFAAWARTQAEGFSAAHTHAVAIGDQELSPAARAQVTAFMQGKNGLANGGPDTFKGTVPGLATGGVNRWRGLAAEALKRAGLPATELEEFMQLMAAESGGNPNAKNNWDSNAKAGQPSQGLMQVIPSTFAAYRDKSLPNNILDPLANMTAAARYIKARYGNDVPGSPYKWGTNNARRGWHLVGENGPEMRYFHGGEKVVGANETRRRLSRRGGDSGAKLEKGSVTLHFHGPVTKEAVDRIESEFLPKLRMAIEAGVGKRNGG